MMMMNNNNNSNDNDGVVGDDDMMMMTMTMRVVVVMVMMRMLPSKRIRRIRESLQVMYLAQKNKCLKTSYYCRAIIYVGTCQTLWLKCLPNES